MTWLAQPSAADDQHLFDVSDRGLLLSDGVFTTALVVQGQVAFRDEHMERLQKDARAIGLDVNRQIVEEAVDINIIEQGHSAIRITITRGCGPRGIAPFAQSNPTIVVSCQPLGFMGAAEPKRLAVSSIRRNETSPTSRHKTLNYLDSILAFQEARERGFDDSIFLNTTGNITCTTTMNIFGIFGDKLMTPRIEDGVLAGIARAFILGVAHNQNLRTAVRALSVDDLMSADGVFLTNCLRGIVPVQAIEDRVFDTKVPMELIRSWRSAVGLRVG
ncbi:MAG: aminotransferase class IV [Pseudomonadota bacterium]